MQRAHSKGPTDKENAPESQSMMLHYFWFLHKTKQMSRCVNEKEELEMTAPGLIWPRTGAKPQTQKLKHHPAWSLSSFICTAETLPTFLKGTDDAHLLPNR